jgi:peptidoglycan hydrolase-like protein with peptidoglycan-binding domain
VATDTREKVLTSPPVEIKSTTPADSPRQPNSTDELVSQKHDESAAPARTGAPLELKSAAQEPVKEAKPAAIRPELLSREELIRIQTRLRGLGFIGTADGIWNQRTQEAIRQFKIANRLGNPDLWDVKADEKSKSPTADMSRGRSGGRE